jgi:imidazolonepropionase
MWDSLWLDVNLATMAAAGPYGAVPDGAIAATAGKIAWLGLRAALPGAPETLAHQVHRCSGAWMTPGLVDCHTHLVFAGHRARDFEMRLNGADRAAILAAGGGIPYTVRATRQASEEALLAGALERVDALRREGVTTIEVKSGYGLDRDTELRQLRIARAVSRARPVRIVPTFLGAHGVGPEYQGRPDDYIDFLIRDVLPHAVREGVVEAVDAGLEANCFTGPQVERLFAAAQAHGLPVKAHTDQYGDVGGAAVVARAGGLSADHLEYASDASLRAMAEAGTVALLLPGANFTLRETRMPNVALMRALGVPMALGSNCNPGSSPTTSPLLMLNMACTMFGLTAAEALAGVTRNAAKALGREPETGTLEVGKAADFALWNIDTPAELAYWLGRNRLNSVVFAGEPIAL